MSSTPTDDALRVTTTPVTRHPSPVTIAFGRETCDDLEAALGREWLVTNGLGGYASGSLAGAGTRRYHGLLVAALDPPVARTVLVAGSVDWATVGGRRFPLSTHEFAGGAVHPDGHRHLESFRLEGTLPVWSFAFGDTLMEKRVWMRYGSNATYIQYTHARGTRPVELEITPLVTYHDFHSLPRGSWGIAAEPMPTGVDIRAFDGAVPFRLRADAGTYEPHSAWWWNLRYRGESERGLDDTGDLFAPGVFRATLQPGESLALLLTSEPEIQPSAVDALTEERARQRGLLERAGVLEAEPLVQQLVLAADQFLVERRDGEGNAGRTVIAGYHWFNDWGRDTMIALPGLTLATGRAEECVAILRTFARHVRDGLLPNNFPDRAGVDPGYNTADATLWYVLAVRAYAEATGDAALVDELLPVLREIVAAHVRGTRYGIGVDPADGLLRAGEPGVQLTWMDVKIGNWVVTPRSGKPVEINALWYNALRALAGFLAERGDPDALHVEGMAERARASFRARFLRDGWEHLADVVDGPGGDDWSVRPNEVFAVSLPFPLLEGDEARRVVEAAGRALLTSYGLRSLAEDDPAYRGRYGGGPYERDSVYHQGTVWTWLLGPYVEAFARVSGDHEAALALLRPIEQHLRDGCLGSISEILEGDPPHRPCGCVAQAWSVAEVLRVWRALCDR